MNLKPKRESSSLSDLIAELAKVYADYKAAEKRLKGDAKTKKNREAGLKERFFDEATKASMTALAKKTVQITAEEASSRENARDEALRRNPGWVVLAVRESKFEWTIILQEDPAYKSFEYVDRKNKLVWTKQIAGGTAYIDDEKLKADDPDLWKRISEPVRLMKPLESLNPEDLAKVQRYIYPGGLQVKLAAPRKAKPEELDD